MASNLIIVVDDDSDVRGLVCEVLLDGGYQVVQTSDGPSLVAILRSTQPALILLDVMMSWVDGFTLCQSIKKSRANANVPVAFLSSRNAPSDVQQGLRCGASDYFFKPLQIDDFLRRVDRLVQGAPEGAA